MGRLNIVLVLMMMISACQSQTKRVAQDRIVGGPCEGCEAAVEYGDRTLSSIDTLPDFEITEPKLKLSGTVYQLDGKTPAEGVVLYIYHTDRNGLYTLKADSKGWGKRHGYLQTWVKTDDKGQYTIYTFRPAAYPSGTEAEHIHITVKEQGMTPYYIDSVVFEDDPLLTQAEKDDLTNRGGSGITRPVKEDGILTVNRDIILGKNIPGY